MLSEIEQRARMHWKGSSARTDFDWLIAEVKRLQAKVWDNCEHDYMLAAHNHYECRFCGKPE